MPKKKIKKPKCSQCWNWPENPPYKCRIGLTCHDGKGCEGFEIFRESDFWKQYKIDKKNGTVIKE